MWREDSLRSKSYVFMIPNWFASKFLKDLQIDGNWTFKNSEISVFYEFEIKNCYIFRQLIRLGAVRGCIVSNQISECQITNHFFGKCNLGHLSTQKSTRSLCGPCGEYCARSFQNIEYWKLLYYKIRLYVGDILSEGFASFENIWNLQIANFIGIRFR